MRLHRLPCSLSRAGLLTEPTPAARRNVFMDPEHVEDMLAHASASFSLQLQKQERVSISANAMREMLDELMTGDVSVIDDTPVMRMPDGFMTREYGEWVAIVPALEGWVDCMQRIAPGLSSGAIVDLGNLLRAGEEITPELVMVARIQLEDQIQAMKRMPIGAINAAVESTKSDWRKEEKLKEEMTMNARDKAPTLPAIDGTINAAHGLLMAATDALSADQVAAMLKTTKKTATAQLKELQGLGFLESELRKGGTRYFRLVVVTEAKPGIPVVADDGCGACGDACASNGGDCRVKEESPPVCESVQTGSESQAEDSPISDEMPPADPMLLASANRMLSDRLEGVAHALRGCGLPGLAEISGAEDLQMATAALSGAYQMVLADLRVHTDSLLAAENGIKALEAGVTQSINEFEAIGESVVDYMADLNESSLIDGIRTMDMLIDAQAGHIKALSALEEQHDLTRCILRRDILKEFPGEASTMSTVDIATTVLTLFNNTQALNDKLQTLLDSSRHECEGLRAELATYINGKNEVAAGKKPTGYIVRTWKKEEPVTKLYAKEKNAGQAATRVVRNGEADTAFVFALVHAGTAKHQAAYVEAKQ